MLPQNMMQQQLLAQALRAPQPRAEVFADDPFANARPLQPGEFRENPDGSRSTEITITEQIDESGFANIPTLWMVDGEIREFTADDAVQAARSFDRRAGARFPRFANVEDALVEARKRTDAGGASSGPLAIPRR